MSEDNLLEIMNRLVDFNALGDSMIQKISCETTETTSTSRDEHESKKNSNSVSEILYIKSRLSSPENGCITHEKLVEEIKLWTEEVGGRITIHDLSTLLDIEVSQLESALKLEPELFHVSFLNKSGFTMLGQEIISMKYREKIIDAVHLALLSSSNSSISNIISELSRDRLQLPLEFISHVISEFSGGAGFVGVYEEEMRNRIEVQLNGIIHGITEPKSMIEIRKSLTKYNNYDDDSIQKIITEYSDTKSGRFVRRYKANQTYFIPHSHTYTVTEQMKDFFTTYGYLTREKYKENAYIFECYVNKESKTDNDSDDLGICSFLHHNCSTSSIAEDSSSSSNNIFILPKSKLVYHRDKIVSPLVAALLSSESFVDLSLILPDEFVEESSSDLEYLIETEIMSTSSDTNDSKKENGMLVMANEYFLYVKNEMIKNIHKHVLPPIIQSYAEYKAKQIFDKHQKSSSTSSKDTETDQYTITTSSMPTKKKGRGKKNNKGKNKKGYDIHEDLQQEEQQEEEDIQQSRGGKASKKTKLSAKEKRRLKAAAKASGGSNTAGSEALGNSTTAISPDVIFSQSGGMIPLTHITKAILKAYPSLLDYCSIPDFDANDDNIIVDSDGISFEVTQEEIDLELTRRIVSFTSSMNETQNEYKKRLWTVYSDLQREELKRKQKNTVSLEDGSKWRQTSKNTIRQIDESFQTNFPDMCYLLQIIHKSILKFDGSQDNKEKIQSNFLRTAGATFARRITEYCFFHHDVNEDMFSFSRSPDSDEPQQLQLFPQFCQPVDLAVTEFPDVYFSVNTIDNKDRNDPLQKLRDDLPREVGVSLARMWILCGGAMYEGGVTQNKNGQYYTKPGSFDAFIKHLEDTCLIICGLPFKILDKKAEKQAMYARRYGLIQSLEQIQPESLDQSNLKTGCMKILDLTTLLLLQQVKQVATAVSSCLKSDDDHIFLWHHYFPMIVDEKENKIPIYVREKLKELHTNLANFENDSEDSGEKLVSIASQVKSFGLTKDISKFDSSTS